MASTIYPDAKRAFLEAEIDLLSDTVKVMLIDGDDHGVNGYDAADTVLDDITAAAIVSTSGALTNKSVASGGTFDADPATFSAVSGDVCEALIFFKDTGDPLTSALLCHVDSADCGGLPITPNGEDILLNIANIFTT